MSSSSPGRPRQGKKKIFFFMFHRLSSSKKHQKDADTTQHFPRVGGAAAQWLPWPCPSPVFAYKNRGEEQKGRTRKRRKNRRERAEKRRERREKRGGRLKEEEKNIAEKRTKNRGEREKKNSIAGHREPFAPPPGTTAIPGRH
jgi:hypothetical protein